MTVTIDGFEIRVPKGTLVIRAAEMLGIQIPRFCDHPLLDPIGACRQCLVEVEGQRKPLASCTTACTEGMVVHTQLTSAVAEKAQRGVMELLLINHPLDCPMCDKGGECPLQNQAMSSGQGETRFAEDKRTFAKPVAISTQVLLDRERCISCTRCVRTSEEIAGRRLHRLHRARPGQFIGTAEGKPFNSYFSGNTVQVCPVGALTGAAYRFRSRPFDLVSRRACASTAPPAAGSAPTSGAAGCMRRLAGDEPAVNEEWNCDKGRWAFTYHQPDRLTTPLVRDAERACWSRRPGRTRWRWPRPAWRRRATPARGAEAAPASACWPAAGSPSRTPTPTRSSPGWRWTPTTSTCGPARTRPRRSSSWPRRVAGRGIGVSYADLEQAPAVLLAGFEPEDESPIVFLRLRKAVRRHRPAGVLGRALASPGLAKLSGTAADAARRRGRRADRARGRRGDAQQPAGPRDLPPPARRTGSGPARRTRRAR